MELLFDAHLDLALNALEWNRDLTRSLADIRAAESHLSDKPGRGSAMVCFEEMRRAGIGLCVATRIAGCARPAGPITSWESPAQAWAMTEGQRAWYELMEELGQLRLITSLEGLDQHLGSWSGAGSGDAAVNPIGVIASLEGADSLLTPASAERAWESGLRAIGPAHFGTGRYACGHDETGGLPAAGRELLRVMGELGFILDVTHLSEACFFEAMEIHEGAVWASHSNCRALSDHPRQFTDEQIRVLIERDGVIGGVLHAGMIRTDPDGVTLSDIGDHIDHICQLAGSSRHVGLGSDLDGGFGAEHAPGDIASIGDLHSLGPILERIGFSAEDKRGFFHDNFLRVVRRAWS